jgi:hypothetical protein
VAKEQNSSSSSEKKSPRQEAFEREAREKLDNVDMVTFDEFMKKILEPSKKNPRSNGS